MGVHPFEDLPKVLEKYADQIPQMVSLVVQKAAIAGGDYLARETPVDTGAARSNWIMAIDTPLDAVIPAYFPYPTYNPEHTKVGFVFGRGQKQSFPEFSRKDETANLSAVRIQHAVVAAAFDARRNTAIYITNSTAHIAGLNEGYSRQSEPGFFQDSLPAAIKAIKGTWKLRQL